MKSADLSAASWRTSTYSGSSGDCVEVATVSGATAIRDSKNRNGGVLVLDTRAWTALLSAIQSGTLDPR